MYRLSYVISILVLMTCQALAQSPHGSELKMDCIACHSTDGWEIPPERWNFVEEKEKVFSQFIGGDTSDEQIHMMFRNLLSQT